MDRIKELNKLIEDSNREIKEIKDRERADFVVSCQHLVGKHFVKINPNSISFKITGIVSAERIYGADKIVFYANAVVCSNDREKPSLILNGYIQGEKLDRIVEITEEDFNRRVNTFFELVKNIGYGNS